MATVSGFLEVLGMPASWLLQLVSNLLSTVSWFGEPNPNGLWVILATAVLLRLILLPLWARALHGNRTYMASLPLLNSMHPGRSYAGFPAFHQVTQTLFILVRGIVFVSLLALLWAIDLGARPDGAPVAGLTQAWSDEGFTATTSVWHAFDDGQQWWRVLLGLVLFAAMAMHQWFLLERSKLRYLMPEQVWRESPLNAPSRFVLVAIRSFVLIIAGTAGFILCLFAWYALGHVLAVLVLRRRGHVFIPTPIADEFAKHGRTEPPPPDAFASRPELEQGNSGRDDLALEDALQRAQQPAVTTAAPSWRRPKVQDLRSYDPRNIADYQLLGLIGTGGMGAVYLARRHGSATEVALKVVHQELVGTDEAVARFRREADALAQVDGAYTARILGTGLDGRRPYMALELLDGMPLDGYVGEHGVLDRPVVLRAFAVALAAALQTIHRLNLVHRDIKPSNVILTSAGPKVIDFGVVRMVDATSLTHTGGTPGTVAYMAPEQWNGLPVGPATDVWAWACTVVYAATSQNPFATAGANPAAIMRAVHTGLPDPGLIERVRQVDPELAAVVNAALTLSIAQRLADGSALLEALNVNAADLRSIDAQVGRGWAELI